MQLVESEAEPVSPDPPEPPEFSELASPSASVSPVVPESASPEVSSVWLPEEETAGPESPPSVSLQALESPDSPELELVSGFELASPLSPEVEVPEAEDDELTVSEGGSPMAETLWGLASEEPVAPEAFEEVLVELAPPVAPVEPEVVEEPVVVEPEVALEEVVALEDTSPEVPPAPESPEVEDGSAVAFPEEVDPVEPLPPLAAVSDPSQPAS